MDKQLIEATPMAFGNGNDREAEQLKQEREILYHKVGQLQVELGWLKEKTGLET